MSRHAHGGAATRRGRCEMTGFTPVPRWTTNPVPGVQEHEVRIPGGIIASLRRLANDLAVPLSSVLLTAHAKVLGALAGETEVWTGYAAGTGAPLPLRMTLAARSWREAVLEIARAESELLAHGELPPAGPPVETVFAAAAGAGELAAGVVVRVAFVEPAGLALRTGCRSSVLDVDCAARIAGYHVTAWSLMPADPYAEDARQTLLSREELRLQSHGLAGPRRELPDARAHELFEE